jgi:hypothetical protein
MTDDVFVIYERKPTKQEVKIFAVGYSWSATTIGFALKRLYHMNPFENRYYVEMNQYKPDAQCYDKESP